MVKTKLTIVLVSTFIFCNLSFANILVNPGFEDSSTPNTSLPVTFGIWSGDTTASVTTQDNISPYEGNTMLQFMYANPVGYASSNNTSEIYQLIDLSQFKNDISNGLTVACASVKFNRVSIDSETDTLFYMYIRAYSGEPNTFPSQYGKSELNVTAAKLMSDDDVSTWQPLYLWLPIPENTDFIAIQINAGENIVNDNSNIEFDGHYADDVSLDIYTKLPDGCSYEGFYTEDQMNQMVQSILTWGDIDGDKKITLSEVIHALRVTSGITEPALK